MADEMPRADEVQNLTPEEVARGLTEGRMLLVDVREPNETAVERYPDAVIVPLSAFDPGRHPRPARQAGGVCLPLRPPLGDRFARRAGCRAIPTSRILAGGIIAWKAAGLPTET